MDKNPLSLYQNGINFSMSIGIVKDSGVESSENTKQVKPVESASRPSEVLPAFQEIKRTEMSGGSVNASDEQFIKALEKAFKVLDGRSTSVQFAIHEKTHQVMVKVMDRESGEVIREMPPEKSLDFLAKVQEMLGLFVDVRR